MAKRRSLVRQHLENIAGTVLEDYQHIIRDYVRGMQGVYALYRRGRLYYVGLASNLRNRLKAHLKDKHAGKWDRFSVYLTFSDDHMRELESLVVRMVLPEGNRQVGKFAKSEDLRVRFRRDIDEHHRRQTDKLLGTRRSKAAAGKRGRKAVTLKRGRRPSDAAPPLAGQFKRATTLRADYKGYEYIARVLKSGKIRYGGKTYDSPSAAARAVRKRPTNGWWLWKYKNESGDWVRLRELRLSTR